MKQAAWKNTRTHARIRTACTGGFTILELALTLAIMGIMAAGVLVPFVAQVSQRNTAATERILDQARETLIGYATATGRFPCPATAASWGNEALAVGGTMANGNCETFTGFLPAVTLGLTPVDNLGFALDAWGTTDKNRIRYGVSNQAVNGITNPFTRTNGMRSATAAQIAATPLLYVCASGTPSKLAAPVHCGPGALGTGGSTVLTSNTPIVIWSVGANATSPSCGQSVDEAQNPNPCPNGGGSADRIFVSRTRSDVNAPGGEFDDVVTWLSVGNLVSRMVMAGMLP